MTNQKLNAEMLSLLFDDYDTKRLTKEQVISLIELLYS